MPMKSCFLILYLLDIVDDVLLDDDVVLDLVPCVLVDAVDGRHCTDDGVPV